MTALPSVLITGASTGIGAAYAERFARRQGRADLPAALACRPRQPRRPSGERGGAGCAVGDPGRDQDLRPQRLCRRFGATRAEARRASGDRERFRQAAANAVAAGFDGVEIHGANGYLLDQFAKDGANFRTDAYGGSVENRARLMLEVTAAVAEEIGADRTGIRLSPISPANGISTSDPQAQFDYVVDRLNALGIVYIHVVEGVTGGPREVGPFDFGSLRRRFDRTYIANNGHDLDLAAAQLTAGNADLFAFGRPFIANPDLVKRLETGAPLATPNMATVYGGGAEGYTDYPALVAA